MSDLEDLYSQSVDEDHQEEATRRPSKTVPSGSYRITTDPIGDLAPDDRAWSRYPGRLYARVRAVIFGPDGGFLASTFFDVSPIQTMISVNGKGGQRDIPERAYAIWLQAGKAWGVKTNGEIKQGFGAYPLQAFVREQFKVTPEVNDQYSSTFGVSEDKKAKVSKSGFAYLTPRTPEQREYLFSNGGEPTNNILTVRGVEA